MFSSEVVGWQTIHTITYNFSSANIYHAGKIEIHYIRGNKRDIFRKFIEIGIKAQRYQIANIG